MTWLTYYITFVILKVKPKYNDFILVLFMERNIVDGCQLTMISNIMEFSNPIILV